MHTRSESTIVNFLMPERIRLSAHQEPTPPTPKMITRFSPMRLIASSPNRSSDLRNIACSIAMNYLDVSILLLPNMRAKLAIFSNNYYICK